MNVVGIEQVRVKRLEGIPIPSELLPIKPVFNASSTIAPAKAVDKSERPIFRPKIYDPETHYMIPLVDIQMEMERIAQKQGDIFDTEIKSDLDRIQDLNQKRIDMLRIHAKEIESKNTWSTWVNIAQYIGSATTAVLGYALWSASPVGWSLLKVSSALLMASGGLGLGNRVLTETGAMQKMVSWFTASRDLQVKITQQIDSAATYISLGMAIAGAMGSYYAGALSLVAAGGYDSAKMRMASTLTLAGAAIEVVSNMGKALAQRKISNITADLEEMQLKATLAQQEVSNDTGEIRKMIELSEAISEAVKRALDASST